ncbi:hypothetical protein [Algicella marina]|uniref:DUF2125 domain-containing protein n=1 Tax=Algicella marina TaxID=2683284 RepID=A0A6P1SXB3_9RHOB|nr:hypothetical protein [Algicella marina]QHQ35314.1 hypothetical protein GO499_08935 [Algicella marina]
MFPAFLENARVSRLFRLLVATCLLAGPAAAEPDFRSCEETRLDLAGFISNKSVDFGSPLVFEDGTCIQRDVTVELRDERLRFTADEVRWQRQGLRLEAGVPQSGSLNLQATGIRTGTLSGNRLVDYHQTLRNENFPSTFSLDLAYDADAQRLTVTRAEALLPGDNSVALTDLAITSGPLNADTQPMIFLSTLKLENLAVSVVSHGLFENIALLPLLTALAGHDLDPEAELTRALQQAETFLAAVPADAIPAASRKALESLLADMPTPFGKLMVRIDAPAGFGMANLVPMMRKPGPEALATTLGAVDIAIRYTPTRGPQ